METRGNIARVEGFRCNLSENGKTVWILPTGPTFQALVSEAGDSTLETLLGQDLREGDAVTAIRGDVPDELLAKSTESQIRAKIDDTTVIICRRRDNVANPFVVFDVVKVI